MTPIEYNPFDPAVRRDPYPVYARLRAEAPVLRNDVLGITAVSRYHDVLTILKSPATFSSRGSATTRVVASSAALTTSM